MLRTCIPCAIIKIGNTKILFLKTEHKLIYFSYKLPFLYVQVRNEFYKDTQGAVVVFDVADRQSFDALDSWMLEMQNEIGNQSEMDNVVVCVCANKVRRWCNLKGTSLKTIYWIMPLKDLRGLAVYIYIIIHVCN